MDSRPIKNPEPPQLDAALEGERSMRTSTVRVAASAAAAFLLLLTIVSTTLGTPGAGIISAPILARGDFTDQVDLKMKFTTPYGLAISNALTAGEVAVQEVTIAPGGTTGWHSHPGPVVVIVKAGALTYVREDHGQCFETVYPAGTAFVDPGQGHVHTAFNRGTENLVLMATYFDVPAGTSPRIDEPVAAPACS
ncbi:MAG TPA: cupin domain-containing protein [Candidatus Polarisedimenticolia bacterium]|nr:cupin domain-containing protein [Candidatus Polarisedimenticolia bacterium]